MASEVRGLTDRPLDDASSMPPQKGILSAVTHDGNVLLELRIDGSSTPTDGAKIRRMRGGVMRSFAQPTDDPNVIK